jgi:hypothetical protein
MQEGFWYSKDEPHYPHPKPRDKPWKGRAEFLKNLDKVESKAHSVSFKGSSLCRCCGQRNGSSTFTTKRWEWPEGLRHYVKDHNVKPSEDFLAYIESMTKERS